MNQFETEAIPCPLCEKDQYRLFAEENGFRAVKCDFCGLIYVNPRPVVELITEAVKKQGCIARLMAAKAWWCGACLPT